MNTAIIIGRFQVPYLHLGHLWLISESIRQNDKTVILIGTQKFSDDRNIYDYSIRRDMIQKMFPQIVCYPLPDVSGDNQAWSEKVDKICYKYPEPCLYYSRDSFKDHYLGKFPIREIPELEGYSGTTLRAQLNQINNEKSTSSS